MASSLIPVIGIILDVFINLCSTCSMPDSTRPPTEPPALLAALKQFGIEWVRRYHRLEVATDVSAFEGPVLFVANHGFGGVLDQRLLRLRRVRVACP